MEDNTNIEAGREGSLDAPTRHPLNWQDPVFYDEPTLFNELERVFDICHGCRRCVSLCNSFPTLFDLVDESATMEVDGVDKKDYWKVVDECYLCDLCYMTKCPYVPPHPWNVDYPHLMLRAKAVKFKNGDVKTRDKILSATDTVGSLAGIPVISTLVNAANRNGAFRGVLEKTLGVHANAILPPYESRTARARISERPKKDLTAKATANTQGKVILFATCYGNRNEPHIAEDLAAVFEHNGIEVRLTDQEQCCGMPKLELGDLESVAKAKDVNVPELYKWIQQGWDIVAPVPSCVLMFKQELPLMFPNDAQVQAVKRHIFDPFEYLMLRHKEKLFNTEFKKGLGNVAYHAPCHLRVQNIGPKTRDTLAMIPDTTVELIERCSGHDGTYAVKREFHETSMKIARPVVNKVKSLEPNYFSSDCPMAGHQIENGLQDSSTPTHPMTLLRIAYGL